MERQRALEWIGAFATELGAGRAIRVWDLVPWYQLVPKGERRCRYGSDLPDNTDRRVLSQIDPGWSDPLEFSVGSEAVFISNYYDDGTAGVRIKRTPKTGGDPVLLAEYDHFNVYGLTAAGDDVFWYDYETGTIRVVRSGQTSHSELYSACGFYQDCYVLGMVPEGPDLYAITFNGLGGSNELWRLAMDGGGMELVYASFGQSYASEASGISFAFDADNFYRVVGRGNNSGSNEVTTFLSLTRSDSMFTSHQAFDTGTLYPAGVAIGEEKVFWVVGAPSNGPSSSLYSLDKSSGDVAELETDVRCVFGVDSDFVYFGTDEGVARRLQ